MVYEFSLGQGFNSPHLHLLQKRLNKSLFIFRDVFLMYFIETVFICLLSSAFRVIYIHAKGKGKGEHKI